MKLLVSILIGFGLNLALTLIGRGRFSVDILILASVVWIAAPLFLFSGIFLAIASRKPHPLMITIGQWLMLISLVIGSSLASVYLGGRCNQRDINAAKAYCEQLADRLDNAKDNQGAYPTNLVGLIEERSLPRVLRENNLYFHSQGTNYSITFSDPGGMMNGWDFIGNTRKWSRFD